jgi:uncharacterized protein
LRFALFESKVYSVVMIVDLIQAGDEPLDFDFSLAPEEINLEEEIARLSAPVHVTGTLTKHIAHTDVKGRIEAGLEMDCTRCLQNIDKKFDIPFEAAFVAPENYTQAKEAELQAEDLDVAPLEGNEIDLRELVREQILLNIPAQVFCREDCKGLCEKCGANRNLIDCKCGETEIDPRWQGLKDLLN